MAKTTLKPWSEESIWVEIESTEPLTEEEAEEVSSGIRKAFSWCFEGESWPVLFEIKQAIGESNPGLANKLTSRIYHR